MFWRFLWLPSLLWTCMWSLRNITINILLTIFWFLPARRGVNRTTHVHLLPLMHHVWRVFWINQLFDCGLLNLISHHARKYQPKTIKQVLEKVNTDYWYGANWHQSHTEEGTCMECALGSLPSRPRSRSLHFTTTHARTLLHMYISQDTLPICEVYSELISYLTVGLINLIRHHKRKYQPKTIKQVLERVNTDYCYVANWHQSLTE